MVSTFVRGPIIKRFRELNGYTREQFAEMLDLTPRFIYDIEFGNKGMSLGTFEMVCKTLNLSADYLLSGKDTTYSDRQLEVLMLANNIPEDKYPIFIEALKELVFLVK